MPLTWWPNLSGSRAKSPSRRAPRGRRPALETLEDRTLLSNYLPPQYRLMDLDGPLTGPNPGQAPLDIARAYLAANAMCGPGSTDELDRKVETIDDPPTP